MDTRFRLFFLFLTCTTFIFTSCLPVAGQAPPGLPTVLEAASPTASIVWFPPTATWTPFPTPIPNVTVEPLSGLGMQTFSDNFSDPKAWTLAKTEGDGGNSIIVNRNRLTLAANIPPAQLVSLRDGLLLNNFYAEVTVRVNRCFGADTYGMLFRAASASYAYRFILNCSGQERVERWRGSERAPLQNWVPSGDAPPGAPGEVKMGVWASGVELRFFLNGHYQFTLLDPLFKNGTLGVFISATDAGGMNVSFSDMTVNSVVYVSPTPTVTPSKTPLPR